MGLFHVHLLLGEKAKLSDLWFQMSKTFLLLYAILKMFFKTTNPPGVDFIKVGRTLQIIEKALSICALRVCRTMMPVKLI